MSEPMHFEVVVIGAGPGGYSAAFRAADLGKKVALIEREAIGGVCLNVGCIPSKALLHAAKVMEEAQEMQDCGIQFAKPKVDLTGLRQWKNKSIKRLTDGLKMLAKKRQVTVIEGAAKFSGAQQITVVTKDGEKQIQFAQAIVAVGSRPVQLPFIPTDPRILDSTSALELPGVDGEMLVLGGGIIGLEMATVYHALGCKITVVEFMDQLIPGADKELVAPLFKRLASRYAKIMLKTKVTAVEAKKDGLWVRFEGEQAPEKPQRFDRILVAVGRRPNGDQLELSQAGLALDEKGFIAVDKQMRTKNPNIFAIGDVIGQPMLAHKAVAEGHLAAEVIAGHKRVWDRRCIPSVAYTDPEIAWVGLTEREAKAQGIVLGKGVFPWAASGRAISINRTEGFTQILVDESTHRVIGAGIVGPNAGELIAEIALAIEMGCDPEDIALTIHPHPTLSESVLMATEMYEGTITDLLADRKEKK